MKSNNKFNLFEDLTPTDEADKNNVYSTAIKSGIDNENVKNIALAGAYGSGKSSILKTFEKNNKDKYKFLNISLADFKGANKKENIDVERSILQKMFYTVKHEDIPFSRFKRIRDLSKEKLHAYSLYSFIWFFSFWIFYQNKDLPEFLNIFKFDFIYYIALAITLIGIYEFLPKIVHIFGNLNFSKINLKKGEVDLAESNNSSILNKNLDEILYFFKVTNIDIVILEDLDRNDDNIEIFLKLREICLIINNSQEINRNITFIYAIRDNNFQDEDRTKFFDLIIPVIPIIDYSNSRDELKRMIKNYKENKKIKENKIILTNEFINEICLYIDDMRLLKNIFNEFIIYKENLNNAKLKNYKLFSILVYKNLFPDDFAMLSTQDGLVYTVISNKKDFINKKSKVIDIEIEQIENEIEDIEHENLVSLNELENIYIYNVIQKVKVHNNRIIVDGSFVTLDELKENFEQLRKSTKIRSEHTNSEISFKSIEDNMDKKTYEERKAFISNKNNGYIEKMKIKLEEKEKEKQLLNLLSLNKLITENSDNIFDEKFKDKGLLVFLLTKGYIDETYKYYISHFYEESITKNDRDFILALRGRQGNLGYEFKLDNINEIFSQVHEYEFKQQEILNYSLFEYLLENSSIKYSNFISLIIESKNLDFIDGFLNYTDKTVKKLFQDLSSKAKWLWQEIELSNFTKEKKDMYLKFIFQYAEVKKIKNLNIENQFFNYISKKNDFISFCKDIDTEKIKEIIDILNIKFKALDNVDGNLELFEQIYNNNHYEITNDFIEKILKRFNNNELHIESLYISNYSTIKLSSCEDLKSYVKSNIQNYIKNVFLKLDTNINETEETIIDLMNNSDIEENFKIEIVKKQETKISDLNSIKEQELWYVLLEQDKLVPTWNNISTYYDFEETLCETLIEYLNIENNALELSKVRVGKVYCEKYQQFNPKLLRNLIETNSFDLSSYEYLIKNIGYWYDDLDISKLDEEKISLLVKYNKFQFEGICFDTLKEQTQFQHIALIEKNIDDYLDKFEEFKIDTNDLIKLLESQKISNRIKKDIIEKIDYDLISNSLIAKLIYTLIDKTVIRSIYYTEKMLNNLESIESRVNLIVEQEEEFNNEELLDMLKLLPHKYNKICNLDGKQTVLNNTNYNKALIELLHTREFITKDKQDNKNQIRLYIKRV